MDAAIESIRKEQAQKLESNIQEGKRAKEMAKRTGGPPPQDASTQYREDTRAGWTPAPAALANFAATDMEDPLARLMTGEAAASWTLDHAPPAVRTVTYRELPDSAAIQAKRHCMDKIDSCGLLPDLPQHLGTYLRNRLTAVNDRAPNAHDVQEFLEDAIREGSAELASEATDYLHNHPATHVGSREGRGALGNSQHTASTGTLGRPFAGETVTMRSMTTATSLHPCILSCTLWNVPNQRRSPGSASTCMWQLAFWPIPRIVCPLSPRSASKRQPYRRKLSAWLWLARTTWARNLTFALKLKTTCASSCTTLSSSATTRITGAWRPFPWQRPRKSRSVSSAWTLGTASLAKSSRGPTVVPTRSPLSGSWFTRATCGYSSRKSRLLSRTTCGLLLLLAGKSTWKRPPSTGRVIAPVPQNHARAAKTTPCAVPASPPGCSACTLFQLRRLP